MNRSHVFGQSSIAHDEASRRNELDGTRRDDRPQPEFSSINPKAPSDGRHNPLSSSSEKPCEVRVGGEEGGVGAFDGGTGGCRGVGELDDEHKEVGEVMAEIRVKIRH